MKIYDTYFIGAHTFETHGGNFNSINYPINNYLYENVYYPQKDRLAECQGQEEDGLICEAEKDDDLLKFGTPNDFKLYNSFVNESLLEERLSCNAEACDVCFGSMIALVIMIIMSKKYF